MEKTLSKSSIVLTILSVIAFIGILMFILPEYKVWSSARRGQAALAHADYERQVQVVNAQANLEAQKYNAEAEVARAEGVQKANELIKNSITELYVKYLWVSTLDKTNNQII
jgi:hypothetical protein